MPYVYRKPTAAGTPEESLGGITPLTATTTTTATTSNVNSSSSQLSAIASSYPERIRKKMEVAAKYESQYLPTADEIREIEFSRYSQVFAASLVRDIIFLRRIREPTSGTEWLVSRYQDTISDDAGDPKSYSYYAGFDLEPVPTVKRNSLREIISVAFDKEKMVYNIPFGKEAVDKVIAAAANVPSDLGIAYGVAYGPDPWRGNELTVWNLEEFIEYPFDVLEAANKGGYLRKTRGGVEQMFKEQKEDEKEKQKDTQSMNVQKTEAALRKAKYQQQQEQQQAQK